MAPMCVCLAAFTIAKEVDNVDFASTSNDLCHPQWYCNIITFHWNNILAVGPIRLCVPSVKRLQSEDTLHMNSINV